MTLKQFGLAAQPPHLPVQRRSIPSRHGLVAERSYYSPSIVSPITTIRPFSVFFPKATDRNSGTSVGRCPSVWLGRRVSRLFSRFMRERHAGRWSPEIGADPRGKVLSLKSIEHVAYCAADFLNWLFARGLRPEDAEYHHVISYQLDIRHGRWGSGSGALSPGWANVKADEACTLLRWMAARGYRRAFQVPTKKVSWRTRDGKTVYKEVRVGKEDRCTSGLELIDLPLERQVADWLEVVRKLRGRAKSLACRAVVEFGSRKTETCSIEVTAWPKADEIAKAKNLGKKLVRIQLTKNIKNGRPRAIDFDVEFAQIVRVWIDGPRNDLAAIYAKRHGVEPIQLFLSDAKGYEGTPISPRALYECFKLKRDGGPAVWYPHLGRHYSICHGILKGLQRDAATLDRLPNDMPLEWVQRRTAYWVDIQRRKSGHVSAQTTEIYTQWIENNLVLIPAHKNYLAFLEGDEHAEAL